MTVCVAAICDDGKTIVGFSDKMLTSRNIETEPLTKIIPLTQHILVMMANDLLTHTDILEEIRKTVGEIKTEPKLDYDWKVRDIAKLYRDAYLTIRQERIEKEILSFYGLSMEIWQTQQHTLSQTILSNIISKIEYYEMENIEAIIAGVDDIGTHLFVVRNEQVTCSDMIGYACIGIGAEQAESEFIFRRHNPEKEYAETLLTAFIAKKRAEAISGVGKETEMMHVYDLDSDLPKFEMLDAPLLQELQVIYSKKIALEDGANLSARIEIRKCVNDIKSKHIAEKRAKKEAETNKTEKTAKKIN